VDATGGFREAKQLRSGVYLLVTHERRNLAASFEITQPSGRDWRIVLGPGCSLQGTVIGRDGKPAAGVYLNCEPLGPLGNALLWREDDQITTDANGRYAFPALAPLPQEWKYRINVNGREFVLGMDELLIGQPTQRDFNLGKK
jgi:hypothetical protein